MTHIFRYAFIVDPVTTLPDYAKHHGHRVSVVRQLTQEEADQGDGLEQMFKVRCEDGWEGDVFESELEKVS